MNEATGRHAGTRRAEPPATPGSANPTKLLLLALGTTMSVVAWGYLVWAAIDFGRTARAGEATAWMYLTVASVGAITCLFTGLLLVVQLLRVLGPPPLEPAQARLPGGRRAKR